VTRLTTKGGYWHGSGFYHQEIQKKNTAPVNAIGVKINPKDEKTMKIWKEEGIDTFIKK